MRADLDIHEFDRQLERAWRNMDASRLTARNKALIRAYHETCLSRHVCGTVWLSRAVIIMTFLGVMLEKDFEVATRSDFEALVAALHRRRPPYRPETISTYKRVLRRFMCYVREPEAFPRLDRIPDDVAWISTALSRSERAVVRRRDLLTPDEIASLLAHAVSDRDRALIGVLWESGARIGEIGNLHVGDVVHAPIGYTLDITGKTGTRTPLVVSSAPYLSRWLCVHPMSSTPSAPLWVIGSGKHMPYWTIAKMLKTAFANAHIRKRAHPHLFRHSRVTHVLAGGIMNEQQAKLYFGWTADSRTLGSTYAHLIANDANAKLLLENGFAPTAPRADILRPVLCSACGELNVAGADVCEWCYAPVLRNK